MRRPALWTAILFASGIWASYFVRVPVLLLWIGLAACFAAGSIMLMLRRSERLAGQVVFGLMIFVAGAFRYEGATRHFPGNHLSRFPDFGERVTLTGRIVDEPDVFAEKVRITLQAQEVAWNGKWAEVCGRVLVTAKEGAEQMDFGDIVTVEGRLRRPEPAPKSGGIRLSHVPGAERHFRAPVRL